MKTIILILFVGFIGCTYSKEVPPQQDERTSNDSVVVSLLFTVKGHSVYRFEDCGHYRYFVIPDGSTISSYEISHGKTKETITEEIHTSRP